MLPRLTAVRALAALAVFLYHLRRWAVYPVPLAHLGYTGVCFFFVLSGFILSWSAEPHLGVSTFYRRRFARVWPSHVVTVGLAAVVPVVAVARGFEQTVLGVLLLQAWSTDGRIAFGMNGLSWSLACEAFFYLTFPAVLVLARRASPRSRVAVAAVALLVAADVSYAVPELAYYLPLARWPEFLVGVLAGVSVREGWRPRIPIPAAVALVLVSAVVAAHVPFPLPDVVMAVPYAVLIVGLALADLQGSERGWLSSRPLVLAGQVSFCFYLVQELVIVNLRPHLHVGILSSVVMLAVSVACAVLLHVVVERPANRVLRGRRTTSTAAAS